MRPPILYPLFVPNLSLPGVGPRLAKVLEKLTGPKVVDVLWHLPVGLIDRRYAPKLAEVEAGRVATLTVTVEGHVPARSSRQPYRIVCRDDTGILELTFFHARGDYLLKKLPVGSTRIVSGRVEFFHGTPSISHPDFIGLPEERGAIERVEPVYPLSAGLPLKTLCKIVEAAVGRAPDLPEWQDPAFLRREAWPSWRDAVQAVHQPQAAEELEPTTPARRRLAYDELLANQLALLLVRASQRRMAGRPIAGDGRLRAKALAALPFALTRSQETALAEIFTDMASDDRMMRLLQGDVGSGKTVVALMAMLNAVEAGCQAALMAPTEILARQHMESLAPLAEAAGIRMALLTGRDKGKNRERTLLALQTGEVDIAVGTHALFQEQVAFRDLGLAIVDEQHRFGVHQRLSLSSKGRAVDVLVMTATPIPRTLTLTTYGDMDVSLLTEKPPGRKPVTTVALPAERLDEVVSGVARAVSGGARVYWVCPLVDESEQVDLAAATERFAALTARFGERVGLVHGRMRGEDKDRTMAAFAAGDLDILVATTVIEVGVNVPEATVMIVEHAERFGLAQLHQLRGRVGRGERPSSCILMYDAPLGETAKARIAILRETEDGFRIAEEDLRLRGGGELLGTRQSGLPEFRVADLSAHGELLAAARDDAKLVLDRDPDLESPRGRALRVLLYLFERDAAVKYLRSG